MRVAILGAGNWGTTLAIHLAEQGHDPTLWEFDAEQAERVARERVNQRFLPGVRLPDGVQVTADLNSAASSGQVVFLATPAQACRSVVHRIERAAPDTVYVSLMKGIEQTTRARISEVCAQELTGLDLRRYAVLSGPTIAREIASGLPTSAVIASENEDVARLIQREFSSSVIRLYRSDDVIGVETAGAMKNVVALAAGICTGMSLGDNTLGALLTRGLAEMSRLGEALGAQRLTFSGLSGMGDLVTTCSSPHSRNRTVGERIGCGETLDQILESMVMVAEGVWTARAAQELGREHSIPLPITDAVCRILFEGQPPRDALRELMERKLKAED